MCKKKSKEIYHKIIVWKEWYKQNVKIVASRIPHNIKKNVCYGE